MEDRKQERKIEKIEELLQRDEPLPANKSELGGDYYYTCYWLSCNAQVHKWQSFCWKCGQRLKYEKE